MTNGRKTDKRADWIGAACGILLVVLALVTAAVDNAGRSVGVNNAPASAQTLTGTAEGRNGPVTVEVVADSERIYHIKIVDEQETQGPGTSAFQKIPGAIYSAQSLKVDAVSGSTITSEAIKAAVLDALVSGGLDPYRFGGGQVLVETVANRVETGSGIRVLHAADWAAQYPNQYASWMSNEGNRDTVSYVEEHPMIQTLYDGYGFAKYYDSARGHYYTIHDVTNTGRPHALANCFTCKTPDFTVKVNNDGDAAYRLAFEDVLQEINDPISCYNCHANTPGVITVTHSYLTDGVGADFEHIDAANLACGQCHVEYYFDPETKATTLPHDSLASMSPDEILNYYNTLMVDGQPFADFTNPNTGIRQIKVQHPEMETYLGEGGVHRGRFTCADCHMGEATAADGTVYKTHLLTSPLDNDALIENTCARCHKDLRAEVAALQSEIKARTEADGEALKTLHDRLAEAIAAGTYTDAELEAIRALARDAQFYWDFVFVENSDGAHNSALTRQCLEKSEALTKEAMALFK